MSINSNPSSKQSKRQQQQEIISPFRLPNDEEVFVFRESEKQKKQQIKLKNKNLRIWDKKTASCRNPKRLFRNYIDEDELKEEIKNEQRNKFNRKDRELINEAYDILRTRQKNKETLKTKKGLAPKKKEGIVELIEQKKEMFLVEKTCNIIKQEIKNLDRKREARAKALESSIRLMKEDEQGFETFKRNNTNSTQDAIKKADDKLDQRKNLENQIKKLRQSLNQVSSLNQRIDEEEQNFKIYKEFLDSITSKDGQKYTEWEEKKQREKDQVVDNAFNDYMERKLRQQAMQQQQKSKKVARSYKNLQKVEIKSKDQIKGDFYVALEDNKIDSVEDWENSYEMYFKEPNQLIKIFGKLEQRNLTLINDTQRLQEVRDQIKKEYRLVKAQLEKEYQTQLLSRQNLRQQIKQEERIINQLRKKKITHMQQSSNTTKDKLKERIIEIYYEHSKCMSHPISIGPKTKTITVLSAIEEYLEDTLQNLNNNYQIGQIIEKKFKIKKEQRKQQQQKAQQKMKSEADKKLKDQNSRRNKHSKKRHGRRDMTKTKPITVKKVEVKQSGQDSEEQRLAKYKKIGYGPHCLS